MRDDFDSAVADRFKLLDDVPVPDTWTRVQLRALDHLPVQFPDEEGVTVIDLDSEVPTETPRRWSMRIVAAAVLAAAVVAIAIVASPDGNDATPTNQPSPTAPVNPTTPPRALPGTKGFLAPPGTYFVGEIDGTPTTRISATVGAGWANEYDDDRSTVISKFDGAVRSPKTHVGYMTVNRPGAVFADACHWTEGYHPGPVTTLDGLVGALSEQGGWADVTTPSDISVDGYVGKAFQRTAPNEISDCDTRSSYGPRLCPEPVAPGCAGTWPAFQSWEHDDGTPGLSVSGPGDVETVWVLDIAGTVVVISTTLFPETTLFPSGATSPIALKGPTAGDRVEFAAVLDSIRINRG